MNVEHVHVARAMWLYRVEFPAASRQNEIFLRIVGRYWSRKMALVPIFCMRLSIFSFWKSHNNVKMRRRRRRMWRRIRILLFSTISPINWRVNCEALNSLHLKILLDFILLYERNIWFHIPCSDSLIEDAWCTNIINKIHFRSKSKPTIALTWMKTKTMYSTFLVRCELQILWQQPSE